MSLPLTPYWLDCSDGLPALVEHEQGGYYKRDEVDAHAAAQRTEIATLKEQLDASMQRQETLAQNVNAGLLTIRQLTQQLAAVKDDLAACREALKAGIKTMEGSYAQHEYPDELATLNVMRATITKVQSALGEETT